MDPYVDLARLPDIPAGAGLGVRLAEWPIALFHVDGKVFAIDDACARCGGSLAAGVLDGYDVECTRCGWRYDVVTGCMHGVARLRLDTFAVKTRGAIVSVANRFAPDHPFR